MSYVIERQCGAHHDYLMVWDKKYGTSCMSSMAHAMEFQSIHDADRAARHANIVCKGFRGQPMPATMQFVVRQV